MPALRAPEGVSAVDGAVLLAVLVVVVVLDAADYEGEDYADGSTPEMELFLQLENQRIKEAFEQLSEVQRHRLLMLGTDVSTRYKLRGTLMYRKYAEYLLKVAEAKAGNYISVFRTMERLSDWMIRTELPCRSAIWSGMR